MGDRKFVYDRHSLALAALVFIVSLSLYGFGFFIDLESRIIDYNFLKRPYSGDIDTIAIVEVTETCLNKLAGWPLKRTVMADAVDRIMGSGAKTLAIDILFESRSATADDQRFYDSLKKHSQNVILGARIDRVNAVDNYSKSVVTETRTVMPFVHGMPDPDTSEIRSARMNLVPSGLDSFGVLRETDIGGDLPSISLLAAEKYTGRQSPALGMPSGHSKGKFFIGYYNGARSGPFTRLSLSSILSMDTDEVSDYLANRLVILGATAKSVGVYYSTPFGDLSEAEVHATIAANIIGGQFARRLPAGLVIGAMAALLLLLAVYLKYSRAWFDFFMAAIVLGAVYFISGILLVGNNVFMDVMPFAFQVILHFTAFRIYQNVRVLYVLNVELSRRNRELTLMDTINKAIINKTGGELLCEVLSIIVKAVSVERGSILLLDEAGVKLMLKYVYSSADKAPVLVKEYISFNIGEGIAGMVAEKGEMLVCNDTKTDDRFKTYASEQMNRTMNNIACVPLKSDRELFGVLNIVNKQGGFSSEDQAAIQAIADQVAVALQNAKFYELAITDGMTKLYIHRYFQARLESEFRRSRRFGLKFSLMMFDIDHFKKFNDTYGHQVGDMVLIHVARTLVENIRLNLDIPARYGGEEFALIMPETDMEGAHILAERIRKSVENSFVEHEGKSLRVTVSIGCAEFGPEVPSRQELILRADSALYRSKETGRNRTTAWDPSIKKEVK